MSIIFDIPSDKAIFVSVTLFHVIHAQFNLFRRNCVFFVFSDFSRNSADFLCPACIWTYRTSTFLAELWYFILLILFIRRAHHNHAIFEPVLLKNTQEFGNICISTTMSVEMPVASLGNSLRLLQNMIWHSSAGTRFFQFPSYFVPRFASCNLSLGKSRFFLPFSQSAPLPP